MKKIILILIFLNFLKPVFASDNYITVSFRELAVHEYNNLPYDYEFVIGGSTATYEWWIMREREYGLMERGSLMDWDYGDFRFQYYIKTADDVEFSEAVWSKKILGKFVTGGGSLYNDIINNKTRYMGYTKINYKNFILDYRYDGKNYYNLSMKFKKRIKKGILKGLEGAIKYRDINGRISYVAKLKYKKDRKKNIISPLLKYEDSSNRPKEWQFKLCYDF